MFGYWKLLLSEVIILSKGRMAEIDQESLLLRFSKFQWNFQSFQSFKESFKHFKLILNYVAVTFEY